MQVLSSPRFINCTVAGNNAAQEAGYTIAVKSVLFAPTHCIQQQQSNTTNAPGGTVTVSYGTVQGRLYPGTNVTSADPLFESSPRTLFLFHLLLVITGWHYAARPSTQEIMQRYLGTITDIQECSPYRRSNEGYGCL